VGTTVEAGARLSATGWVRGGVGVRRCAGAAVARSGGGRGVATVSGRQAGEGATADRGRGGGVGAAAAARGRASRAGAAVVARGGLQQGAAAAVE
jgi:hypothetical protein